MNLGESSVPGGIESPMNVYEFPQEERDVERAEVPKEHENLPYYERPREEIVSASSEIVRSVREGYDTQLEGIEDITDKESKIKELKSFIAKTVDFADLTQDESDSKRITDSYQMLGKELGGAIRHPSMSDEVCRVSRYRNEGQKIKDMIEVLKETYKEKNFETIEEYAGKYAFAIEQLARTGQHEQAMRELNVLDAELLYSEDLKPDKNRVYQPPTTTFGHDARRRIDNVRLYLWQECLESGSQELPALGETFKIYDGDAFRRLGFRLAYQGPSGIADRALDYVEKNYFAAHDELQSVGHRADAFIETGSQVAYAEAIKSVVDAAIPAGFKARTLIAMSIEGADAFNGFDYEDRQQYAGAAQHVLNQLDEELREHNSPNMPLNPDKVAEAMEELTTPTAVRKIGEFISRTFVMPARKSELDADYLEAANKARSKLMLEVAHVTGQPEDMRQADKIFNRSGGPRSALDGEGHKRNLEYAIRQVEVLARQRENVDLAERLARADNLADSHERAQLLYVPMVAGAMIRYGEIEDATRLLNELATSQAKLELVTGASSKSIETKHTLLNALVDQTDTAYSRRNVAAES